MKVSDLLQDLLLSDPAYDSIDDTLDVLGIPYDMDADVMLAWMKFFSTLKDPDCPICGESRLDENENCMTAHWSYDVIQQVFGVFLRLNKGD